MLLRDYFSKADKVLESGMYWVLKKNWQLKQKNIFFFYFYFCCLKFGENFCRFQREALMAIF